MILATITRAIFSKQPILPEKSKSDLHDLRLKIVCPILPFEKSQSYDSKIDALVDCCTSKGYFLLIKLNFKYKANRIV